MVHGNVLNLTIQLNEANSKNTRFLEAAMKQNIWTIAGFEIKQKHWIVKILTNQVSQAPVASETKFFFHCASPKCNKSHTLVRTYV